MLQMKIISVVGTRPNFIKIAPLVKAMGRHDEISHILVHTGQHYDKEMSKVFFDDMDIPKPGINLGIGSDSDVAQTARIMIGLEKVLAKEKPSLVIVVGDVNSTLAAALTARKLGINIAHIEAGLRSFDDSMPEETNRILTDHISSFLFTTEKSANKNLVTEGIDKKKIFFVGNVMIDTLLSHRDKSRESDILGRLKLKGRDYAVLTLHRPSNVDDRESLARMLDIVEEIQKSIKIVLPAHPRTLKKLNESGLSSMIAKMKNVLITNPLGYLDFLHLMDNSMIVFTDSGGIQEETTILGIPCITLRDNTERPVTMEQGTNILVSTDKAKVLAKSREVIEGRIKIKKTIPELWDGKAAERIVKVIMKTQIDICNFRKKSRLCIRKGIGIAEGFP